MYTNYKIFLGIVCPEDDYHIIKFADDSGFEKTIDSFDKSKLGLFLYGFLQENSPKVFPEILEGVSNDDLIDRYHSAIVPWEYKETNEDAEYLITTSSNRDLFKINTLRDDVDKFML